MDQLELKERSFLTDEEHRVWNVIKTRMGRDSAIPMRDLARLVYGSSKSTRRVQEIFHELVRKKYPVGSSCGAKNGYFRIVTLDDLVHARSHNRKRGSKIFERDRAYEHLEKELRGQERIDG